MNAGQVTNIKGSRPADLNVNDESFWRQAPASVPVEQVRHFKSCSVTIADHNRRPSSTNSSYSEMPAKRNRPQSNPLMMVIRIS